jgi:hypothetical protein
MQGYQARKLLQIRPGNRTSHRKTFAAIKVRAQRRFELRLRRRFWRLQNRRRCRHARYCHSINVACGFFAGDPDIAAENFTAAKAKGIAIGAHPDLGSLCSGRRLPFSFMG